MIKKINYLPRRLFPFILFFLKKQWVYFSFILLTTILWPFSTSFSPYFIKLLINKLVSLTPGLSSPFREVSFPLIGLFSVWIFAEISCKSCNILCIYVLPKFRKDIRSSILSYTQNHSYGYFSEHFTGEIANKISELPRACTHILEICIENFFSSIITFLVSFVIVFQANYFFGLILFFCMIIFFLVTILSMKNINYTAKIHAKSISELNGKIVDSMGSILAVQLFARTDYELNYINRYQTYEVNQSKKASWVIEKYNFCKELISLIFIVITFCTLVYAWNNKWITIGDCSLIVMVFFNIISLLWHSSFHITQIAKEVGISKAALSILSAPHEIKNSPNAMPLVINKGAISLDKVTFNYKNKDHIFNQISVNIKGGEKVGLVGLSGSGKTTFVHLILRLYNINSGKILIDNQDISKIIQSSIYEQISIIPQDPILFHRTIFENIQYGRLDAKKEEVLEAARLAHCMDFIQNMESGFQTMVGERGMRLSGGQRQRIAIARAIIKNAPILIMDEATSALDSITEKSIQQNLKKVLQNSTALVIAHRLSTLENMDRILVFDKGMIIEDGTISELLAINGNFSKLWKRQGIIVE